MASGRKFGWHSGTLKCKALEVDQSVSLGSLDFGAAELDSLLIKGRASTSTVAGAALSLPAEYTYGEGMEFRWSVASWTGVGSSFRGMYVRSEAGIVGATHTLMGMEVYGVANNVGVQNLKGILSYAYIKGATAKTVGTAYGLHAELTWDAGASTTTLSTEASSILAKITGGVVNTYTLIHGIIMRSGDMDGASRTYGNAILVEDDSAMAGTITWTKGLSITSPCTTIISLTSSASTTGINVAPTTCTTGISVGITGVTYTTGIAVGVSGGTLTSGITTAGTLTTAITIGGTVTTAIDIGTATLGIKLGSHGGASADNALLMGIGTSASPASTSTADKFFAEFRTKSTATSGSSRGLYWRHEINGVNSGSAGECLRAFTKLTASCGTVRGAHLSLDMSSAGAISGLGVGVDAQILLADAAYSTGTLSTLNVEWYASGTSTAIAGTQASFLRCVLGGNATGAAAIEDVVNFATITGGSNASGNVVGAAGNEPTWASNTYLIRSNLNGQVAYLVAVKV